MTFRRLRTYAFCALAALLAAGCSTPPAAEDSLRVTDREARAEPSSSTATDSPAGAATSSGGATRARGEVRSPKITPPAAATKAVGVSEGEITVAYYWKGDRTRSSPYLKGTGGEYLVDEAEAFRTWIAYINKHADGGELMGYKFDLHGRKLRGVVIEAGDSPEANVAAVTDIKAAKPFAAVAAHGSVSAYACPLLASAGIFNLWTYDLDFDLKGRSKGWCLPGGATFDDQVHVMERYLMERVAKTKTSHGEERVFGLLYAEYPGLVSSAPKIASRLRARGLKIAEVRSISASLSEAQQQATTTAAAFRAKGVNTMIIPDAGAPIAFTPAAQAIGYDPDYMVWPCSGQDAPAMVRLYAATQWTGATGLTCYAQDFMIDLRHGEASRQTEWHEKYTSMGRGEPPAQAPFVYGALLPLVAGITEAGPDLNAKSFLEGLSAFDPYRYASAIGRTARPNHMRLGLGGAAHPFTDDFTILRWSSAEASDGGAAAGAYVFPENGRRYPVNSGF